MDRLYGTPESLRTEYTQCKIDFRRDSWHHECGSVIYHNRNGAQHSSHLRGDHNRSPAGEAVTRARPVAPTRDDAFSALFPLQPYGVFPWSEFHHKMTSEGINVRFVGAGRRSKGCRLPQRQTIDDQPHLKGGYVSTAKMMRADRQWRR